MNQSAPANFEQYLLNYPKKIQERLQKIRSLVKKTVPGAVEKISYGMPAFTLHGMLIYFAAHTKHIGLYPFTTAIEAFTDELKDYKTAKGSIQFPNNKPLPLKLISQIIEFRVEENRTKAELKAQLKSKSWKQLPGLVFDTRSVLLSLSGLFFGLIPTIIASVTLIIFRLFLGGPGVWMGITVIITAASIGYLWRNLRPHWRNKNFITELVFPGYTVHLVML